MLPGTKYHKIDSIFKRDKKTGAFLIDQYTNPEFEYLAPCQWTWHEKIDGTNIRIIYHRTEQGNTKVQIGGRTDKAQIPSLLMEKLQELFPVEKFLTRFHELKEDSPPVILFGEGIGPGIQKVGSKYRKDSTDFILFDVRIGRWWLKQDAVQGIAKGFDITPAPHVEEGTLQEAIEHTKDGFLSQIAEDHSLQAEGLILRPKIDLLMRSGSRIITKIKTKDFKDN